jgi:DNA gyrase/topoisomerase IV subunit A
MSTNPERTAEDFFDTEYRDYALYTIEQRALPSLVDGFKPSQRKIAYAANILWKKGTEKPLKVFQLGGQAAALAFYHHGSLDGTIIGMAQDFKNALPIFKGIGQFGSLRSPSAGAARYVGVKFNENFRRLYMDFELTTPRYEEGEEIEPRYFLPIIPTVLLNGGSGIAVGFATKILNRHPLTLVDAVTEILKKGSCPKLPPWIKGFFGEVTEVESAEGRSSWKFHGACTVLNTTTVEITEIPPSFTYEKYEALLDKLQEQGHIRSYEDSSSERVRYNLRFTRAQLSEFCEKPDGLSRLLKLEETQTENITTLDEHGKLKIFQTPEELAQYFVEFRLSYYEKRKAYLLKKLGEDIEILDGKAQFVKGVVDQKIKIANVPKADIIAQVEALGIAPQNGQYDYLLSMPISALTRERYAALTQKLEEKRAEREKTEKTPPKTFFLRDLQDLRKKLVSSGWGKATKIETSQILEQPDGPAKAWLSESSDDGPEPFDLLSELLK